MIEKKVHLNEDILKGVSYRVKLEDVDESTAIRQFIKAWCNVVCGGALQSWEDNAWRSCGIGGSQFEEDA